MQDNKISTKGKIEYTAWNTEFNLVIYSRWKRETSIEEILEDIKEYLNAIKTNK